MDMLGPYELNTIVTGDARELEKAIPDESVDLIFTDPVYDRIDDYRWLAETAARVLKPNSACLVWAATPLLPDIINAMSSNLLYKWQLIHYRPNRVKEKFGAAGFCKYEILLWYEKGCSKMKRWLDLFSVPVFMNGRNSSNHMWSKEPMAIYRVMGKFSGSIILDPFTGGGTVPAVCKMLRRNYLAFEIDSAIADMARQRVAETQPPLLIDMPEQMSMSLD